MINKIPLPWCNKFRELLEINSYAEIIIKFSQYIDEQEKEFNELWKKQEKSE